MDIKILVASHKPYKMPTDEIYLPIHVGKSGKQEIGFIGDDTGDNVSAMNSRLCELTAIYWAWRNLEAEYIGLVHYRRHFCMHKNKKNKFQCVLKREELEPLLKKYDMVLPKQRRYVIETIYSHFIHLPHAYEKDIKTLREVISEVQPDYLESYDRVMNRTHAHMFNMFIMKKKDFDEYCEWLFSIILEADRRIDVSTYTPMEARAVAYYGEFMIDIWNDREKLSYCELPVVFMEKQNWIVKIIDFIKRKFGVKTKYFNFYSNEIGQRDIEKCK